MQGFKIFFELLDDQNLDDVRLTPTPGKAFYHHFKIDDNDYTVSFSPTSIETAHTGVITNNAYEIVFRGPKLFSTTNLGRAPTIYAQVVKAIKKLIQTEKPEGFKFHGYDLSQNVMYNAFYNKYLKTLYTRIDLKQYLRNDILEQKPQLQQYLEPMINLTNQEFNKYKQNKIANKQKMNTLINKVAMDSFNYTPVYVINIQGAKAQVLGFRNNLASVWYTQLVGIIPIFDNNSQAVLQLIQYLKQNNLPVNLYKWKT